MKINISLALKMKILKRDNFTCQKCGFSDKLFHDLEIHHIKPRVQGGEDKEENLIVLCSICHNYAPDLEKDFKKYLIEKIDGQILNTFRNSKYSISNKTKFAMEKKAKEGCFITKAPKGYKIINKQLIPAQNSKEIEQIFQEFLNTKISLTQLAKKFHITTAGLKKLLQNTTYIGKVKFSGQEADGKHTPLLSKQLFMDVQKKLHK